MKNKTSRPYDWRFTCQSKCKAPLIKNINYWWSWPLTPPPPGWQLGGNHHRRDRNLWAEHFPGGGGWPGEGDPGPNPGLPALPSPGCGRVCGAPGGGHAPGLPAAPGRHVAGQTAGLRRGLRGPLPLHLLQAPHPPGGRVGPVPAPQQSWPTQGVRVPCLPDHSHAAAHHVLLALLRGPDPRCSGRVLGARTRWDLLQKHTHTRGLSRMRTTMASSSLPCPWWTRSSLFTIWPWCCWSSVISSPVTACVSFAPPMERHATTTSDNSGLNTFLSLYVRSANKWSLF